MKNCYYNYTVSERANSNEIKKMALLLYLEGFWFGSIERFLKVSHVSVMNWIKRFGEELEELKCDNRLEIIEMNEMHTFIGLKKAIVGYVLLLTDLEKDLSTAFLVHEKLRQEKNYGINLRKNRLKK